MSILHWGHKYSLSCQSGTLFDTSYNSHCKHFWLDCAIWGQKEITECNGVSHDVTMDAVVTTGVSRDVTIDAIVTTEGPSWFLCQCPPGPLGSRQIIEECPSEPLGCRRIIWECPSEPWGQGSWHFKVIKYKMATIWFHNENSKSLRKLVGSNMKDWMDDYLDESISQASLSSIAWHFL